MLIRGQEGNIGINTSNPKATLDVTGKPTSVSHLDGIIAPRLTGNELRAKSYGIDQTGALIYATASDTSPSGQTINVTKSGYFYFDGTKWVAMTSTVTPTTQPWYKEGTTTAATDNNENAYIMGNVGIGTANPTANLDVKGIIKSTNPDGSSLILANGANRSEIYFADGLGHSGNDYSLRAGTTTSEDTFQILNIITGGAPFTILPNNNIGIGTVTPTTKLDIDGETKIRTINSGTLGTDNILVSDATGIIKSIPANSITEGAKAVEPWYKEGTTTAATNNNENAYIMGNVGIGTANPTANLQVAGNTFIGDSANGRYGTLIVDATSATNEGAQIMLLKDKSFGTKDWSIDQFGGGGSYGDNPRLRIFPGSSEYNGLSILENGNVGIGDPNPTVKLDVNGKVSAVEEIIVKPATDSEGGQVKLVASSNAPSGQDGFLDIFSDSTTSGVRLFIGPNGEGIYIADGKFQALGNVGIGTPNPTTKLDIAGETKIRTINSGTLGTDNILVSDATGIVKSIPANSITEGAKAIEPWYKEGTTTAATNNNDNAYIMGNVGIGTANPTAKLDINGSIKSTNPDGSSLILANGTNRSEIYFADGLGHSGSDYSIRVGNDGPDTFQILNHMSTTSSNPLTILANDNIGIGTISPTAKLDINGEAVASTQITIRPLDSHEGGQLLLKNGSSGAPGQDGVFDMFELPTKSTSGIRLFMGGNADGIYIADGKYRPLGNVGIGVPDPTEKLDVAGNIKSFNIAVNSDKRLKKQITDIGNTTNLFKLRHVSYYWNDLGRQKGGDAKLQYGFIAQEVEKIFPDLVTTDATGYKSVNYIEVIPMLTQAIQEQKTLLEALEARIKILENTK